jgi:hypothetical protein
MGQTVRFYFSSPMEALRSDTGNVHAPKQSTNNLKVGYERLLHIS